ncbi:MAG: CoA-binding protein [Flavobacteriales bacterium]|nr:CoA-binding protein [Flavobacteriales bacterium]
MKRTTLVLGASTNPARYSYMAIQKLRHYGHTVIAIGPREGTVADVAITLQWPVEGVDTVTLYIGPSRQPEYYDRVIALRPRRVIFNPGTENDGFAMLLREAGIVTEEACTLVMLGAETY